MYQSVVTRRPDDPIGAPPLLFVHGAWHGAWCWEDHFLPWFAARGFESHALDLRGHGASDNDRSLRHTGIDHYVADVARAVDDLDRPPVVVGHSMGGFVVQRYLLRHRLPGAVLLATVPSRGAIGITLRTLRRHPGVFLKINLGRHLWPLVATPALAREHLFADDATDAEVMCHHARLQDESYRAFLDLLVLRRARPEQIETPVLVVGAERDRIFPVDEMVRTAEAYRGTPVIVPAAAHDLMLDARWEQAAEAIRDWVIRLSDRRPQT